MDEFVGALVTALAWIARFLWRVVFDAVFDFVFQVVAGLVMWPFRRREDAPASAAIRADAPRVTINSAGRREPGGVTVYPKPPARTTPSRSHRTIRGSRP